MDDSGVPPENTKFSMPEFKCSQCDYKTKGPKQYELHLKAHEFKKPMFTCPSCHHLFTYAGNLRTHREKHCKEIKRSRVQGKLKTSGKQISQEIQKLFQTQPTQESCALKLDCQAPGLVPPFTFSGPETVGKSLLDLLNSIPVSLSSQKSDVLIPEKEEDGIWIQSLKQMLQQPLKLFNTDPVLRDTAPVTQLFENDPLPPMSKEITGLNDICVQNLMDSTSLQSLGLLNTPPTPQPATLLDLLNSTTVPQSSQKSRCDVPSPKIDEYESYIQSLKDLKTLQQPFEFLHTTPDHQPTAPVLLPPFGTNSFEKDTIRLPKKKKHPLECVDCAIGFKDEAMYIVHRLTHLDNNSFKCALCGKQFYDRYSFTSHIYLQGHEEIKI
ncbi:hypothetical protein GCK72_007524 [Caenorhabditis remanei]|uniref:C2H2-type domain-containing protein n=1 Tax=Caenorhabditis remanei TaxID=31234 RepID=A0A6A5HJA7_CAERE|nr:hypothetical protein GCK72_007524 [Caenorhabditis remanei]KAF1767565.1 hypothetical protein GCK72_007524 [Caenorhabditis remanei]